MPGYRSRTFTLADVDEIVKFVETHKNSEALSFTQCKITVEAATELGRRLVGCKTLKYLKLDWVTTAGFGALLAAFSGSKTLKTVNVYARLPTITNEGHQPTFDLVSGLIDLLTGCKTVKDLTISGIVPGNAARGPFFTAIKNASALTSVSVNGFMPNDAFAFFDAVRFNPSVDTVNLDTFQFGQNVDSLTMCLTTHPRLRRLRLMSGVIPDLVMVEVANALATSTTVKDFELSAVVIGDAGGKALANAIATHRTLEIMRIDGCVMSIAVKTSLTDAYAFRRMMKCRLTFRADEIPYVDFILSGFEFAQRQAAIERAVVKHVLHAFTTGGIAVRDTDETEEMGRHRTHTDMKNVGDKIRAYLESKP